MKKEARIAPRNSLILVMDKTVGEVPKSMNKALVAATPSCVAVGTLSEYDGETLISLSDGALPSSAALSLVFEGVLKTPARELSLCSVLDETILTLDVPTDNTRVQIWANADAEPDEVHVVATEGT
jgi:hypothetical protein